MLLARQNSRKALATLAWGALFLGLAAVAAEIGLPRCLDLHRDFTYQFRRDRLIERYAQAAGSLQGASAGEVEGSPALIVALGTSRSMNAFDARLAEERLRAEFGLRACVSNFAVPVGTPYHSLAILGRLLREDLKPDVVVVEVLPAYFAESDRKVELTSTVFPLNDEDRGWLKEHDVPSLREEFSGPALIKYRTAFMKSWMPILLPKNARWHAKNWDDWGTYPLHRSADSDRVRPLNAARAQYHDTLQNFELGTWGTQGYRMLLTECRSRGIRTVLVIMPEGPEFRSWYREGARQEIVEQVALLARESGSVLVNAWDWVDEQDFIDSHHQYTTGAKTYTSRLVEVGLAPCLVDPTQLARRATTAEPNR